MNLILHENNLDELKFRPMRKPDLRFFNSTRNESAKWLHDSEQHSYDDCVSWFKQNKKSFYYIFEKNGERLGYFRFSDVKDKSLYIGADINKAYRGNGYSTIAYSLMFKHLKNSGYNTLYLEVLEFNYRAIHVYKKLGFIEIDRIEINRNNTKTVSIKMKKVI